MLEDAPVAKVDTAAIEKRQQTIVEAANALVVDSTETLATGEQMAVGIKAAIKTLHEELDPGIAKANETHKHLTGQRKKYEDPLKEALRIGVGKTSTYRRKEEEKRRVEESRLRAVALKEAEEAKLAEAVELDKAGHKFEAAAVIEEEVKPPPVVVAPTVPKSDLRYRETWIAEVTDHEKVPREYMMANMTTLNALARATKGTSPIPGVEFRSKISA